MQATQTAGYAGEHHHDGHGHYPTGWKRWVTTTNHKDIGTMYLWFSFVMFLVGGAMSLIIRAELFSPGLQYAADPQLVIEGSIQIPVFHNSGPLVLRTNYNLLLGVKYLF